MEIFTPITNVSRFYKILISISHKTDHKNLSSTKIRQVEITIKTEIKSLHKIVSLIFSYFNPIKNELQDFKCFLKVIYLIKSLT